MLSESWVVGLAAALYLILMYKSGRTFPIAYLFVFTYFVQYVLSTWLIYNEYRTLSYQMPIPQDAYFAFVLPALSSLFAGFFLISRDVDARAIIRRIDPVDAARTGYLLLMISLLFDVVRFAGLQSIESVVSFTTYLKYLAAFCFLFTRSRLNSMVIVIVFLQLGAIVLRSGVFVSFFIWSTFLFFFITLKYDIPYIVRTLFILAFVPVVVLVQGVKMEYRDKVWREEGEGGLGVLSDLAAQQSVREEGSPLTETKGVVSTVGRLSQGWHLGLVLRQVPLREPIAEGSELIGDITASIVPRILFADKKSVNSQDKFLRFTGHRLRGSTSMSIGILGDFYINFGRTGAYVGLFLFGILVAWALSWYMKNFVLTDPINIIWIPFLLSYLIRANNDFYIFFNALIKGFVIFLIVNFIRYKWYRRAMVKS